MHHSIQHIGEELKAARKRKGLSQSELGKKIHVPQSHISKIENGAVDLQISSLIELSRALDLEVVLLPRQLIPAFKALQSEKKGQTPAYQLDEENDE